MMKILIRVICAVCFLIGSALLMYGCLKTVRSDEAGKNTVKLDPEGKIQLVNNDQEKQMAKVGFTGGAIFLIIGGSVWFLTSKKQ